MPSCTAIKRPSPTTIVTVCDGARRPANSDGYCAEKSPRGTEPLPLMVPKDPFSFRQSVGRVLITGGHAPFAIGSEAAVMVNFI